MVVTMVIILSFFKNSPKVQLNMRTPLRPSFRQVSRYSGEDYRLTTVRQLFSATERCHQSWERVRRAIEPQVPWHRQWSHGMSLRTAVP